MFRRLWLASVALVILAASGQQEPVSARGKCLLADSECTLGSQCCSNACYYDEGTGDRYCLVCGPGGTCDP
jgi:hypothetical protein